MPLTQSPPIFERLAAGFEGIAARAPDLVHIQEITIAGAQVRWRFAGPSLARRIGATFAHLRSPAMGPVPDLTISLWDVAATGTPPPEGDFDEPDLTVVGRVQGGNLLTARGGDLRIHWTPRGLSILDVRSKRGFGWIDEAGALTQAQEAQPLRPLLLPWLVARGLTPIHAGCVAKGGRGVLIGGPGGSGKSTCSLAAGLAGLSFLGDDYVALADTQGGGFTAHSLYGAAWLEKIHSQRLPAVAAKPLAAEDVAYAKRPFDTGRALQGRLQGAATVTALLLPRLTDTATTHIEPAARSAALGRVAADALLRRQWFASPREALPFWTRVVSSVPCYWLNMGRDFDQLGRVIADSLQL